MISNFFAVACLFARQYYRIKWVNNFRIDNDERIFFQYNQEIVNSRVFEHKKRFFTMNFMFEVTLLMVSPIPYYDRYITYEDCKDGITVHYLLSEFLVAIMILRMYFLIRTFFNFSLYADAISKKICKNYGFEAGVRYTIKCLIIVNPEVTVLSFFFGSLFIGAYIVRIFEMPYYREVANGPGAMDGYFGAIYLVTITITTVGYGDLWPGTNPGRLAVMILACWGGFVISLLVVIIQSVFDLG